MRKIIDNAALTAALLLVIFAFAGTTFAQVSITTMNTIFTQEFDGLPASGSATWTNNTTIPGWYHARTGTGTTVVADAGTNTAGNLYSYGTGTATDRAIGSIGSGNAAAGNFFWGVRLRNNTGAPILRLDIAYTGEQWRNGASATAQTIAFSYVTGATVTGTLAEFQTAGTAVTALDFASPINGGSAGALNGNLAANRSVRTAIITGINIPNGGEIMLRWSDPDHGGTDHGLAIDEFRVSARSATAATGSISGRVTDANGRPIAKAIVSIIGPDMIEPRRISTGHLGYYSLDGLTVSPGYVVTVESGRHTFSTPVQVVDLQNGIAATDFVADFQE